MLRARKLVRMVHRGLPLDEIEDVLSKSSAYRQASALIFVQQSDIRSRPGNDDR